ncbi:MAG: phosphoribosylglycinamide formyltransferase [candidate division Zixibacteria bacterium]|nr:phosphoribosylglycinamide formyltransferase [candidate division Zixibacteria bacterium]
MNKQVRLAVFISGSGTNLQSIIDRCADGTIPAEVALVVSSDPEAYGLVRAEKVGIEGAVYRRKDFPDGRAADDYLLDLLDRHQIDIIALAGYLKMVAPAIISRYRGRVVNIHPGILPKYGGKGMYGHFVHEAVVKAKEKETGVTIHIVDEIYDHGTVLACEKVPVFPEDTPDELAQRVLKVEHALYPRVLKELSEEIAKEKTS